MTAIFIAFGALIVMSPVWGPLVARREEPNRDVVEEEDIP